MAETATKLPVKTEKNPIPAEREWTPFESLRREIDRLFDDFHPFRWRMPARRPSFDLEFPMATRGWAITPAFDVVDKENEYEITAELPGIDEKNVEIKISNHLLTIRGEKQESKEQKEKEYYLSERRYGSFQRSFQIPEGVAADRISASFTKGVLTVCLPKTTEAQKAERKIPVQAT